MGTAFEEMDFRPILRLVTLDKVVVFQNTVLL